MRRLLTILTCFISSLVLGQSFTAEVNQTSLGMQDVLQYSMVLKDISKGQYSPPDFSKDFYIISGPNQSSQTSIINGKRESVTTISYDLRPRKMGTFKIAPASIEIGDKTYSTEAITITVRKPTSEELKAQKQAEQDLFIQAVVSTNKAYVGEPITVQFKLYSAVNLGSNELISQPDFTGFWSKDIKTNNNWRREYLNGKQYQTAIISQYVLIPQSAGKQRIDPMTWNFNVLKRSGRSRDPFASFFSRPEEIPTEVSSKPISITVKPLPNNGKPADFSGAVGSFSLSMTQNKTQVKANEGIDVKIRIAGDGNLELLNIPKPEFPTEFDVYDPKINNKVNTSLSGMSGSKENDYLIIPRLAGNYTIPGMRFSFFNPKTERYEVLTTDDLTFEISEGSAGADLQVYAGAGKSEVEIKNKDIRFIKTETSLSKGGKPFSATLPFYLLVLSSILLPILAFFYRKKQLSESAKPLSQQGSKLRKIAKKELSKAEKALQAGDRDSYFQVLYTTINDYLSRKLNIEVSKLNREPIGKALMDLKLNNDQIDQLFGVLNTCEMARFAPIAKPLESMHEEVITIIELIESKS